MARFFVDRPVFAWVVALFILLAGVLALVELPIAQYPTVAPPSVIVTANYPGRRPRSSTRVSRASSSRS